MSREDALMERRRHPRIDKQLKFNLKTVDDIAVAETINLSCSGAYCVVNKHIPLMTELELVFALPYGDDDDEVEYIQCNGIVVRVEDALSDDEMNEEYHIAIFFNFIEETNQVKLNNYIERQHRTRLV